MGFSLKNLFSSSGENRLVTVYDRGTYTLGLSVVVDTVTGVNYLIATNDENAVSVTVMVNADGKPLVTEIPERDSGEEK